jgi:hypothetical protein
LQLHSFKEAPIVETFVLTADSQQRAEWTQGDQIGRILAHTYKGDCLLLGGFINYRSKPLFIQKVVYYLAQKIGLGEILGEILTDSSGHPEWTASSTTTGSNLLMPTYCNPSTSEFTTTMPML